MQGGVQLSLIELKPKTWPVPPTLEARGKDETMPIGRGYSVCQGDREQAWPKSLVYSCAPEVCNSITRTTKRRILIWGGVGALQNATEIGHKVTFVSEGSMVVMNACI